MQTAAADRSPAAASSPAAPRNASNFHPPALPATSPGTPAPAMLPDFRAHQKRTVGFKPQQSATHVLNQKFYLCYDCAHILFLFLRCSMLNVRSSMFRAPPPHFRQPRLRLHPPVLAATQIDPKTKRKGIFEIHGPSQRGSRATGKHSSAKQCTAGT
jgi:hypothetical protein